MRLSGSMRIGVVAYAVWLAFVGWYAYGAISPVIEKNAAIQRGINDCLGGRTDFGAEADCGGVWEVGTPGPYEALPIAPYVLMALAPPILILLSSLAFVWIRRGFERDRNSN